LTINTEMLLNWYELMWKIRRFEEGALEFFSEKLVRGSVHPYIGMEAGAVGMCATLQPDDLIITYHRGHGHCLAKGMDARLMMAELIGRENGYCRGKGGTMHIASLRHGVLGADGVVGGNLPVGIGAAYPFVLEKQPNVVLAFFGEGAVNQGTFHEALNLATVLSLPVVFVCENNYWALNTRSRTVTSGPSIANKACGYGIPGVAVDATDVMAVYQAGLSAVEHARRGEGPLLFELQTYRWTSHSAYAVKDPRPEEEVREWKAKDPIAKLGRRLLQEHLVPQSELDARRTRAFQAIEEAMAFAVQSSAPDPSQALQDIFAFAAQATV